MNRSILIVVIVGLAILGVGGYFSMKSGIGKESGPPTESEVIALIKSEYERCADAKYDCSPLVGNGKEPFVSFKKTDGKLTAPSQYNSAEYYTMFGVLTVSSSGKDIAVNVQYNFERRESGWVLYTRYWSGFEKLELKIPR